MELLLFTAAPFILAPFVPLLIRVGGRRGLAFVSTGLIAILFIASLLTLPRVTQEGALTFVLPWVPDLGLTLSFYLDGLALLFTALVTGVGIAVFHYTGYYFDDADEQARFTGWMLVFTGSMLWVVLAGNILALFIAWELTSISSFMLIGFKGAKDIKARQGALQALMITGGGGLALFVGLLLTGSAVGSMEITNILAVSIVEHPYYTAAMLLVALGAFTKSAQFPFHFWLPGAMSAPSPASAFLHSATMVKAGVYLLARMYPTLGNSPLWTDLLTVGGLLTLFIGSALALRHRDLKGMLAYTTIAQLGALVALIGLPEYAGFKALMVGILAHALYKAPLFLSAGIIEHSTGTRIIDQLGGLRRHLPGLAVVVGLACVSMAGIIPLMGFVGKETLLESFYGNPLALGIITISAALGGAVAFLLFWDVFIRPAQTDIHFHAPPRPLSFGPGALALGGIVGGLALPLTIIPLITPAVPKSFSLVLFPGINTAFILSTIAVLGGLALFAVRRWWVRPVGALPLPDASGVYNAIVAAVEWSADQLLKTQNGKLRHYLVAILGSVALLMLASGILLNAVQGQALSIGFQDAASVLEIVLVALALGAAVMSIIFRNHLSAALALGIMGYAVGGIFLMEPAPDVALVQFLVETLGTVLVVMMIGRIAIRQRRQAMAVLWGTSRGGVWRDIAVSVVIGTAVGLFALTAIANRPERTTIAEWHIENAYPQTGAPDVVAAIIADFRATDTLIEIAVFSMAAVGVATLLARTKRTGITGTFAAVERRQPGLDFNTPFTRLAARIVLPFALLVSLTHILYGGGNPGDGFTAGVVSGLAVALWYVVFGYEVTRWRLRWLRPWRVLTAGLALALINAVLPLIFGREFFAITKIAGFEAPAGLHLASTLIFEVGIFLAVFGGASLIMETITHPEQPEAEAIEGADEGEQEVTQEERMTA